MEENKKANASLIALIIILILFVLGLSIYIVYDKFITKDAKVESKSEIEEKKDVEEELDYDITKAQELLYNYLKNERDWFNINVFRSLYGEDLKALISLEKLSDDKCKQQGYAFDTKEFANCKIGLKISFDEVNLKYHELFSNGDMPKQEITTQSGSWNYDGSQYYINQDWGVSGYFGYLDYLLKDAKAKEDKLYIDVYAYLVNIGEQGQLLSLTKPSNNNIIHDFGGSDSNSREEIITNYINKNKDSLPVYRFNFTKANENYVLVSLELK
ncbi:MAG: hypothetical protein Q4E75_05935 [bacterium]|nr:hypothetical protein [bacterium]